MSQYVDCGTKSLMNASAAIARYLRVKLDTNGELTLAGADDLALGVMRARVEADVAGTVMLVSKEGTIPMVASEAITRGRKVFAAASGKVAADGGTVEGIALEAASADGDIIEVLPLRETNKKVAKVALAAASGAGGVLSWQNPEGQAILVTRIVLDVTTAATGAATVDVGVDDDGADSNDSLIDGLDVNAATGVFDNVDDQGTNGQSVVKVASGYYVVGTQASGDVTGLVGSAYIEYMLA